MDYFDGRERLRVWSSVPTREHEFGFFWFFSFFQPTQPLRRTSLNIQRPFRISATSLAVLLRWERKQQETRLMRLGVGGWEGAAADGQA